MKHRRYFLQESLIAVLICLLLPIYSASALLQSTGNGTGSAGSDSEFDFTEIGDVITLDAESRDLVHESVPLADDNFVPLAEELSAAIASDVSEQGSSVLEQLQTLSVPISDETPSGSQQVTLSASFQQTEEGSGTIDFTFEVEEPASPPQALASAGLFALAAPLFPPQTLDISQDDRPVPEPATALLIGLGILSLAIWQRKFWGRG